jgi:hypothetical protein
VPSVESHGRKRRAGRGRRDCDNRLTITACGKRRRRNVAPGVVLFRRRRACVCGACAVAPVYRVCPRAGCGRERDVIRALIVHRHDANNLVLRRGWCREREPVGRPRPRRPLVARRDRDGRCGRQPVGDLARRHRAAEWIRHQAILCA